MPRRPKTAKLRRRYGHTVGRHRLQPIVLPEWVERTTDACLRSVAEDAYTAKGLADGLHADTLTSCENVYRAGLKSLADLENTKLKSGKRCAAGDRAARKFWEAKVCARQERGRP